MRQITYRGPGTGLRLDGDDGSAMDVGGSHAPTAPMHLWLKGPDGKDVGMDLDQAEVVLLIEECAHFLARRSGLD
jgi:hypothetical protein